MSQTDIQESFHTLTFHQLQHFRGKKQEDLKSLQRKFIYNMKIVAKRKKQKLDEMDRQRKRENFLLHKRTFSQQINQLKTLNNQYVSQKRMALKQSIQIHREQKTQSKLSLRKQLINKANLHRLQRDIYHDEINKEKAQTFRHKRKLYHKQRLNQNFRKIKREQRLVESKRVVQSEKNEKIMTQCSRIESIDKQIQSRKNEFQWSLNKAVDDYNRLSMN